MMNQEDLERAIIYGTEWLEDEYLDARDRAFIEIALEALEQMPVITTTEEEGVIYYPQVEGVTPTVVDAGKQEPCDTCGYEEGSIYCKEHCPHEAKIEQELTEFEEIDFMQEHKKIPVTLDLISCDDAISRQAVLDLVNADWKYEGLEEPINSIPPVTPQQKTGHWRIIEWENPYEVSYICSKCGRSIIFPAEATKEELLTLFPYCHCGAKMIEPQERSE